MMPLFYSVTGFMLVLLPFAEAAQKKVAKGSITNRLTFEEGPAAKFRCGVGCIIGSISFLRFTYKAILNRLGSAKNLPIEEIKLGTLLYTIGDNDDVISNKKINKISRFSTLPGWCD